MPTRPTAERRAEVEATLRRHHQRVEGEGEQQRDGQARDGGGGALEQGDHGEGDEHGDGDAEERAQVELDDERPATSGVGPAAAAEAGVEEVARGLVEAARRLVEGARGSLVGFGHVVNVRLVAEPHADQQRVAA